MKKMKQNEIILENGIELDLDQAFRKLTERMFGGHPARAASEIVQNMLDSYESNVSWDQRRGDILTKENKIVMIDYGSGLTMEKLELLCTMGASDKTNDSSKIGQFGIGFFSIFNHRLGTKKVVVTTQTNEGTVVLTFHVISPGARPKLEAKMIEEKVGFSTKIEIYFSHSDTPQECLLHIKNSLENYPCKFNINGKAYSSLWERESNNPSAIRFNRDYSDGIIYQLGSSNSVKVLCKYEPIIDVSLNNLMRGTVKATWNLEDYKHAEFTFIPKANIIVNCNSLSLTISRDSFFLNYNYLNMFNDLNAECTELFLKEKFNNQLLLANLYIYQNKVATYLKAGKINNIAEPYKEMIIRLANAKIFQITGERNLYSVKELKNKLTKGLPLFYSPNFDNLNWCGRIFKHDFILLPERCHYENGAKNFYQSLLKTLFEDVVNLDRIQGNQEIINQLIERGIVSEKALSPKVKFVGEKKNNAAETKLLQEINTLLKEESIIKTIEHNLFVNITSIETLFFTIEEQGAYISTGLFDENRKPIDDDFLTNFLPEHENDDLMHGTRLFLGLQKDHPLIVQLISSTNLHRAYFALSYIANELVMSQKMLKPHSRFYNIAREKLAVDLRNAMIKTLIEDPN
jgi:predicted RNA binding protein with dsRBD fold (UPF0201 family)